ncbi:MAG: hypothetical protein GXY88_05850, partial [Tissierellia bacterium]|nr:hypothetical protein [Tissierellia bacterium]
ERENIDLSKAVDIEIAVKDINSLNYYEAKVEDLVDNTFYISSIKLIPSSNTFNLLWNLEGILYYEDTQEEIPIDIVKIGGYALSFCLSKNMAAGIPCGRVFKLKVLFEDYDIDITGTIIKRYNLGSYVYFDLQYTNIPDVKRDAIYRQLFRKQIELRKSICEYKKDPNKALA